MALSSAELTGTAIGEEPSKFIPLIVFPGDNFVAVPALPVTDPEIGLVTERLVRVPTLVRLLDTTEEFSIVPVSVPASAVIVIGAEPSKFTPLIARGVAKVLAVLAFPVNAPVNDVEETEVNPDNVVEVAPKAMLVVPIVRLLLVNAPLGMLVKPAPDPANSVAVRIPVLGTKLNLVEDNFAAVLPEALVHNG